MTDYITRELPRVCEALMNEEQQTLYQKIKMEGSSSPYEAFLIWLCFLHAMQPMRIVEIKIGAIDVERRCIHMKNTPNIYLLPVQIVLLKECLVLRGEFISTDNYTLKV